ncbi:contactin-5-like [Haliotis cracherodii]|uniref:contactin-5-like n=1 Tax=Haliotis cracherodii TaxID=6455 RepID=UPI0039E9BA14
MQPPSHNVSGSAPVLATNRRVPVEGVSFSITCTLDAAVTSTVRFYKGDTSIQGACLSSGTCGTSVSGYNVSLDSTSRILTLDITSPDSTRDSGTWRCNDGTTVSNMITLSQFAAVLDWSSVTFSPQLTSLPSSVTPQNTISVTVTTPCAAPAAVITWRYQQSVSGAPPSSTSSSQGSCPSGQVQTTNTLSLPGNTASLYNRQVSLTVSVEHDSFDLPTYTKSVTSNTIQFPVPVTTVTLTNISSVHETIGLATGQTLTLICVTSASFPTSTVTWVTLPSGTPPTVSRETTSGVLVKTTSSVTFTVSKTDQGRSIHCQAENINGQTSPQSNRATLEVWYPPDKPTTTNPGTLCEGKSTSLTCSSSPYPGNPPSTYYWTKDNAAVHTGSSYTFSPWKTDNGADIRCAAGNNYTDRAGSSRRQSDARLLSVYYMGVPTITPAATQTRKEGQSLSLTCSADGNPDNAVISWTFNDSPIPGSSVMKVDLNRSDDGEYVCIGRVNTGSVCPGGSLQGRSTVRVIVNWNPDRSGVSASSLGIGLGLGLGICIIVIIVMGAGLRRRHLLSTHDRGKPAAQIQDRDIREQPTGNTQNSGIQDLNQYARFEECASQPYSQLKIYENNKGRVPHEPEYKGPKERSQTTYETVALHTYESTDRNVKDPTYVNASTTG